MLLLCLFSATMRAQERTREISPSWAQKHLWYGAGLGLGFSAQTGATSIQLGLSPMVGYKITPSTSIGPRINLQQAFYWARVSGGRSDSAFPFTFGVGLFARQKVYRSIFAHVEYEWANEGLVRQDFDELSVIRLNQRRWLVGGGYSMGQTQAYEIVILFDITQAGTYLRSPLFVRGGFTYNF